MAKDKVVDFQSKLQARVEAAADREERRGHEAARFRILARAVRDLRDNGATTKEIAHTLRLVADELDGNRADPV